MAESRTLRGMVGDDLASLVPCIGTHLVQCIHALGVLGLGFRV